MRDDWTPPAALDPARRRRWRPYPDYRDSGVPWLGEVPAGWDVRRLKHIASISFSNVDKHSHENEIPVELCNYVDVYKNDYITAAMEFMKATALPDEIDKFVLQVGDVLLTKDSEAWNDIAIPAYVTSELPEVLCGYHLALLRPKQQEIDGRYLFRALQSNDINYQFVIAASGITRYGIGKNSLDNGLIFVPPLPEQRAIAAFLDRETARLDALIAKKERLIALLHEKRTALISHTVTRGLDPAAPLQDSGVPWLGEVPSHWQVIRLKHLAEVRSGTAKGRDFTGRATTELPYLRVANVQDGYLDLSDVATIIIAQDEIERYSLQKGDVLMNEGGDFDKLGRGYVWDGSISPCVHQNHVFAVRPKPGVNPHWINIITLTDYAKHYFILKSKQTTNLASISGANLQETPVLLPPSEEQDKIMSHLDRETAKLDTLIAKVQQGIELLREYRTALISAAVTGRIDVREPMTRP